MPVIITAADLAGVPGLGAASDDEKTYAARRAGDLVASSWCTPTDPVPQWVKDIAVDVAVRYLSNPRNLSSVTRTKALDDASRSETERYADGTRGGLSLTDDELTRLCPTAITGRVAGIGSMRLRVPGYQP